MTEPINSGAPDPVFGVIGGPVAGGGGVIDNNTGNIILSPPGNTTQFQAGSNPQAIQVYEYFVSATDYSRISIVAQTGGPFLIAVETAPAGIARGLIISATGPIQFSSTAIESQAFAVVTPALTNQGVQLNRPGAYLYSGAGVPSPTLGVSGDYYFRTGTPTTAQQRIYVRDAVGWVGVV